MIPEEIWLSIFSFLKLECKDWASHSTVCKAWCRAIPMITSLVVTHRIKDANYILSQYPNIKSLCIKVRITGMDCEAWCKLTKLTLEVPQIWFCFISELTNLTSLSIPVDFGGRANQILSSFSEETKKSMTCLNIQNNTAIRNDVLAQFTNLTRLNLKNVDSITSIDGLTQLRQLKLTSLSLHRLRTYAGKAKVFYPNGLYEGNVKDGMLFGFGKMKYYDGSVIEGEWSHGYRSDLLHHLFPIQ